MTDIYAYFSPEAAKDPNGLPIYQYQNTETGEIKDVNWVSPKIHSLPGFVRPDGNIERPKDPKSFEIVGRTAPNGKWQMLPGSSPHRRANRQPASILTP